jgi:hypothetical protein
MRGRWPPAHAPPGAPSVAAASAPTRSMPAAPPPSLPARPRCGSSLLSSCSGACVLYPHAPGIKKPEAHVAARVGSVPASFVARCARLSIATPLRRYRCQDGASELSFARRVAAGAVQLAKRSIALLRRAGQRLFSASSPRPFPPLVV